MSYRIYGRILPEDVKFEPFELEGDPLIMPELPDDRVLIGGNMQHGQTDPEKAIEDMKACLSRHAILSQMLWSELIQPGDLNWYTMDRNDALRHGIIEPEQ
jgi:hypothetical protein